MATRQWWLRILGCVALVIIAPRPASAEWFGDLYLGIAHTGSKDIAIGSGDNAARDRDVYLDNSGVAGGRVGYWFNDPEWLAVAFDVFHYQPDISSQRVKSETAGFIQLQQTDISVTGLSVDLMLRFPIWRDERFPHGRLQPYVLIGPTLFIAELDDNRGNFSPPDPATGRPRRQSDTEKKTGFHAGFGVAWQVLNFLAVFGEYRYVNVQPTFDLKPSPVNVPINSHLLLGGISFRY